MNRGRRRAGPGLTGLKDGVKRRLFDPHLVPTRPDEKSEINRLLPLTFTTPTVRSLLTELRHPKASDTVSTTDSLLLVAATKLNNDLLHKMALFQLAFRKGPYYHSLPELSEGIDVNRVYGTTKAMEADQKQADSVLLAHLLVAHHDLAFWSGTDAFCNISDPEAWYPKELMQLAKVERKADPRFKRFRRDPRGIKIKAGDDLNELVPADQLIPPIIPAVEEDETVEKLGLEQQQEQADSDDSDDARWNGEVQADPDDLDEDELDNDYCQTYFDNGEGDLSDTGLGGPDDDDDGRSKYYD